MSVTVHHGDSREVLRDIPDASVDSCVCDPPYALVSIGKRFGKEGSAPAKAGKTGAYKRASAGFMGQKWDNGEAAHSVEFWAEVFRVLKPGGHVAAFSGTRTQHRQVCAIEDAGFEIRDQLGWLFGSGFPKSHNQSGEWEGWGSALKPAWEPICLARKPLIGTIAANLARYGTGALNIAACRVSSSTGQRPNGVGQWARDQQFCDTCVAPAELNGKHSTPETKEFTATSPAEPTLSEKVESNHVDISKTDIGCSDGTKADVIATNSNTAEFGSETTARSRRGSKSTIETKTGATTTPATCGSCGNPITAPTIGSTTAARKNSLRAESSSGPVGRDGEQSANRRYSEAGSTNFAATPGPRGGATDGRWPANVVHDGSDEVIAAFPETASGVMRAGTARKGERTIYGQDAACGDAVRTDTPGDAGSAARFFYSSKADSEDRLGSKHPTVKPVDLMAWLCRLVTPLGGTILDPFAGTGTTGLAAMREGFDCILIEREATYYADIQRRLAWARGEGRLTAQETSRTETKTVAGLPLFGDAA